MWVLASHLFESTDEELKLHDILRTTNEPLGFGWECQPSVGWDPNVMRALPWIDYE